MNDVLPIDVLDDQGLDYKETSGTSGDQLNIKVCPSCGNSRWKTYVNAERGYGNCFSCGETFNLWTLTKAILGTEDKSEVAKYLGQLSDDTGFRQKRKEVEVLVEEVDVRLPTSLQLPTTDGQNLKYLEERGFDADLVRRFHLRFCMVGKHNVVAEEGESFTQDFSNRVLIPVYSLEGDLVTFQGRDVTGKSDKKYLFPAKLPSTGRFLFNGHVAYAKYAKKLLIGEGAFDVMAQQKVIDEFPDDFVGVVPVGTFGKKLSAAKPGQESQMTAIARLKKRGLQEVTVMWDGEQKALVSALEACAAISGLGLTAKVALLPKGKDPNEVLARDVRDSFVSAEPYSRSMHLRLKLSSPYK